MIYLSHLASSFVLALYHFVSSSLSLSPSPSSTGGLSPSEPVEIPTYISLPSQRVNVSSLKVPYPLNSLPCWSVWICPKL